MEKSSGPAVAWQPVSPALPTARTLALAFVPGIPLLAVAGVAWWFAPAAVAVGITLLAAATFAIAVWAARRSARAWAYFEGDDELLVRSGRLVQKLVAVPYGRMQLVDLASTPIERRYGLATVQLHTAAATSHARIVGVPREEAELLRQRLVERGQARSEGL
ncbi:MAG: rane-flanked domain [Frankiales bacterium]|nr:rane-flanked domain [Frankiales bacterium]